MLASAAAVFGVLMGLAPIFQIVRMVRQRSSADVSFAYVAVLAAGFGFFLAYGVALHNVVLIVSYSVSLVVGCVNLVVIAYFRATAVSLRFPSGSRMAERH
jgi:uncharacterized protein with PQ loop repeat